MRYYIFNSLAVFPLVLFVAALALTAPTMAQEVNALDSALSINGTGKVNAAGSVVPSSSSVFPTPVGSAPLYHHLAQAGASMEFRVQGTALGQPIILLSGSMAPFGTSFGGEFFELDFFNFGVVLNGMTPTNIFEQGAVIGPGGSWTLVLGQGLPASFPSTSFQAAIVDPTAAVGLRFTGSVTLEMKNDIDTLGRNFMDSLMQAGDNPLYILGLASTGFLWEGMSASQLMADLAADPVEASTFVGVGKNQEDPGGVLPPIPTGAPTTGQSVTLYIEGIVREGASCGTPSTLGEHIRLYDMNVVEEGGVWKVHGDQKDVGIWLELEFRPGTNQGLSVYLHADLEDMTGAHGGIAGVTISGPQLQTVIAGQATSAATGTQSFLLDWIDWNGSEWDFNVELASLSAGSSRMPLVETASTGPRDTYTVTVTWNDPGYPASVYANIPLRAALDVDANAAAVVAALPTLSTAPGPPPPALVSPGTWNASVNFTLDLGVGPPVNMMSHLGAAAYQGATGSDYEHDDVLMEGLTSSVGISICTPYMSSGSWIDIWWEKADIFGARYQNGSGFIP